MAFQIHSQHVDTASGFHVIELRDERGNRHMVQIAIGHLSCPACGKVYPRDVLTQVDPRLAVADVINSLDHSQALQKEYAERYGLAVK